MSKLFIINSLKLNDKLRLNIFTASRDNASDGSLVIDVGIIS